jgi:hypothetical protein
VVMPVKASASSPAAGAAASFKSCLIFVSFNLSKPRAQRHGMLRNLAPSTEKKSKAISSFVGCEAEICRATSRLQYGYHTINSISPARDPNGMNDLVACELGSRARFHWLPAQRRPVGPMRAWASGAGASRGQRRQLCRRQVRPCKFRVWCYDGAWVKGHKATTTDVAG